MAFRAIFTKHQLRSTLSPSHFTFSTKTKPKTIPILWDHRTDSASPASSATQEIQLLSWGRGASGQLGGGIEEIRIYPSSVASILVPPSNFALSSPIPGLLETKRKDEEEKVIRVGISCGLFHSGLLVDGKLWIWGKGDGGRLGLGHENPVFVPTLNENLMENVISSISFGGMHSVALDSAGQVFSWGYGGFGALGHVVYTRELYPRLVEGSWSSEICHIATGGVHTAAITKSGELYTWGREEGDGRLGLGPCRGPDQAGGLSVPYKVEALTVPVAAVSCGGFFTMGLTEEGQLWNWGANSNYELGRGDKNGGWKPRPVPSLENVRIKQIANGGYHSLALTDNGEVLSWGHGGHGQLGHSTTQNEKVPKRIEALATEKFTYIACGGSSSAAITGFSKQNNGCVCPRINSLCSTTFFMFLQKIKDTFGPFSFTIFALISTTFHLGIFTPLLCILLAFPDQSATRRKYNVEGTLIQPIRT